MCKHIYFHILVAVMEMKIHPSPFFILGYRHDRSYYVSTKFIRTDHLGNNKP